MSDQKIVKAFNTVYGNFLKVLKTTNEDNRSIVKEHYKAINKNSSEYLEFFSTGIDRSVIDTFLHKNHSVLNDHSLCKGGITISKVLEVVKDDALTVFWNFIYTMLAYSLVYSEKENDTLFDVVHTVVTNSKNAVPDVQDILDEDISELLSNIVPMMDVPSISQPDMFANIEGSFIGNLAKEISEDINIDDLKLENPEDILKMMDFSSGENNIVGNIVKKVSSRIQEKIGSGELNQGDLIKEVMGMMGSMGGGGGGGNDNPMQALAGLMGSMGGGGGGGGNPMQALAGLMNNPMMADMMKSMKKGKAAPKSDILKKASTRERLRAKFEERQNSSK